jgi:prevent-host-death family protein
MYYNTAMEYIGLREFNHNLSSIMARVAAGASIVVTDRGKPIVDLTPHRPAAERSLRDELIASGALRPAVRSRRRLPPLWPEISDLPDSTEMIGFDRKKDRER